MAFGVVLFSLLAQGTASGALVRRLGLVGPAGALDEYQRKRAQLLALHAAWPQIDRMRSEGLLSPRVWEALQTEQQGDGERVVGKLQRLQAEWSELEPAESILARREALAAQRGALRSLLRRGELTPEAYRELAAEIDTRQAAPREQ